MRAKTRATIEDLCKVEGKAELVNGEIVEMPPAGDEPNVAGGEIFAHLREYVRRTGSGRAYTDGIGFHVNVPHRNPSVRTQHTMSGHALVCGSWKGHPSLQSKSDVRTTMAQQQSRQWQQNAPTTSPVGRWSYGM
jgi:hypothetical protein